MGFLLHCWIYGLHFLHLRQNQSERLYELLPGSVPAIQVRPSGNDHPVVESGRTDKMHIW